MEEEVEGKDPVDGRFTHGNQFWTHRSKHGRDTLFASPEKMWEAAAEYFQWCIENPLLEVQYVGKDAVRVEVPKMRPFTLQGLCRFLDCNLVYLNHFESNNTDPDFSKIVTRIRETIYEQKFTGAAAGFLKESIIVRDLGLADKKDLQVSGDIVVEYLGPDESTD